MKKNKKKGQKFTHFVITIDHEYDVVYKDQKTLENYMQFLYDNVGKVLKDAKNKGVVAAVTLPEDIQLYGKSLQIKDTDVYATDFGAAPDYDLNKNFNPWKKLLHKLFGI